MCFRPLPLPPVCDQCQLDHVFLLKLQLVPLQALLRKLHLKYINIYIYIPEYIWLTGFFFLWETMYYYCAYTIIILERKIKSKRPPCLFYFINQPGWGTKKKKRSGPRRPPAPPGPQQGQNKKMPRLKVGAPLYGNRTIN